VHKASGNAYYRVFLETLHVRWSVSVFEVSNSQLTIDVQTPCKQETFRCRCHAMLPTTCDLLDNYFEQLPFDKRRFEIIVLPAELVELILSPAVQSTLVVDAQ